MPSVSFSRSHAWPSCVVWASSAVVLAAAFVVTGMPAAADAPDATMHLGFETTDELLADFASQAERYEAAGLAGLEERRLAVKPGRFGNCLHIEDGSPSSKGTWNESGLDCDLIVAVMWGEWHKKPHYWGAGAFHGRRGTVAFWVKDETLHPGIVFMQGSTPGDARSGTCSRSRSTRKAGCPPTSGISSTGITVSIPVSPYGKPASGSTSPSPTTAPTA